MIRNEIKRVLFSYKAIIVFLVGMIVSIGVDCAQVKHIKSYKDINAQKKIVEEYEGYVNEEKLLELYSKYQEKMPEDFSNISNKYYAGEIDINQYFDFVEKENAKADDASLIGRTIELAEYAQKDREHRCIVFQDGWKLLLTYNSTILICITILFYALIIFASDAGTKVEALLNTAVNGKTRLLFYRTVAFVILTTTSVALYQFARYICIAMIVGLPGASFPLQSLIFYGDSKVNCTLIGGYLIQSMYLLAACLFAGGVSSIVVCLLKDRYVPFLVAAFMFLCSFIFKSEHVSEMLPIKGYYSTDILLLNITSWSVVIIVTQVVIAYVIAYVVKRLRR